MSTSQRPLSSDADLHAMAALVQAFPDNNLHVVDLPYRLCSWALDEPDNVGLWFSDEGELRAWAVMQAPFWCIDMALHPHDEKLYPQLLAWAERRAAVLLSSAYGRPLWFVNVPASQTARLRALEAAGFSCQANVPQAPMSMVLMRHSGPLPTATTGPAGFSIRSLTGETEVDAYVACHQAAFQSDSMRAGWRARTLRHPAHQPDLDLAAYAPSGRLVGFCICWLNDYGGQIEPIGVHPDFRGLGLGRTLLAEGIRRLRSHGARRILVMTDSQRDAALALYESVGFRVIEPIWVYRKDWR